MKALEGVFAVGAVGPDLALPRGPQAVVSDGGDTADPAGDVARQLGHEEYVAVAHYWDGALPHKGLMVAYHRAGEIPQVLCAAVDLARWSVRLGLQETVCEEARVGDGGKRRVCGSMTVI